MDLPSLRDLGELRIVDLLERALGRSPSTVIGFGDDVSAIRLSRGKVGVLKTDMLVGSTDVPPGMMMRQAARKAVVANVSDLAAKGVRPLAGLVALGLQRSLTKHDVQQIAAGLASAAGEYGFHLVGGDTNESEDLTISIALFAMANRGQMVLRSGARVGDVVAVTGKFGSTSAGLKAVLEKRRKPRELPKQLYDAVYNPRAQLNLGVRLASSRALTSSIDSSDGLAWSLHELSEKSHVGILIDRVPVSRAALQFASRYGYRPNDLALFGGEEYNLVVTVKPERFESLRRAVRGRLTSIGTVTSKRPGVMLELKEELIDIPRKGWEHFRQQRRSF
jgi:thiamine-monophosphate kinase